MLGRSGTHFQLQQVRHISKRTIAYPPYPFSLLANKNRKIRHDSNLKYAMRQFLGPKNFKGEYIYNRYFSPPQDHKPKYVTPDLERGQSLRDPVTGEVVKYTNDKNVVPVSGRSPFAPRGDRMLRPFPQNEHCRTNFIIDEDTRLEIYEKVQIEKLSAQEVSRAYGLKVPRIEAIVKLVEIEKQQEKYNRIKPQQRVMADTLFKMFPVFKPSNNENLSEIPIPSKALSSRFLTIAESQPFGPVDAAKVLELEPAAVTLEKLSTEGEHAIGHDKFVSHKNKKKVVYGELLEGERSKLKFVHSQVGKVGFRYGSGNRDNRKNRAIGFNELGKMVYL